MDKLPLPLLSPLPVNEGVEGERESPAIPGSRAPVLPPWALWLAVDDDGGVYAYDQPPDWLLGVWFPADWLRCTRVCTDSIDWPKVMRDPVPARGGNGRCYLLIEPAANYVRRPSLIQKFTRFLRRTVRR